MAFFIEVLEWASGFFIGLGVGGWWYKHRMMRVLWAAKARRKGVV